MNDEPDIQDLAETLEALRHEKDPVISRFLFHRARRIVLILRGASEISVLKECA